MELIKGGIYTINNNDNDIQICILIKKDTLFITNTKFLKIIMNKNQPLSTFLISNEIISTCISELVDDYQIGYYYIRKREYKTKYFDGYLGTISNELLSKLIKENIWN